MLSNIRNKKPVSKNNEEQMELFNEDIGEYIVYTEDDTSDYEEYKIVLDDETINEEEKEVVVEEQVIEEQEEQEEQTIEEVQEQEEIKEVKRTGLFYKIINIIFILIIIIIIIITTDVILVGKYGKGPIFAIPLKEYQDGGTKEYYGIGYKVIKYNQLQGRRDKVIGTYKLKYNTDPVNVDALELATEANKDEFGAYKKYYKKFIRIDAELKEYDTKNNTITIGFIDEAGKYSIDIKCNMATTKEELKDLELYKQTTVIGTVIDYETQDGVNPTTLYLDNCFSEQ